MGTTILPSGQVLRDYSGAPAPALPDRSKANMLRNALSLLMSQIDYSMGACPDTARINSLVKPDYLESIRVTLEITK